MSARTLGGPLNLAGALILAGVFGTSWAQVAPTASPAPTAGQPAVVPVTDGPTEDTVQLSPFEVNAAQDRGYYGSSTMSGTRLSSSLEDIAASISVVTKQQLMDEAATDINDVFMYEAGTEGIYQYTSFSLSKGNASDDVSADPNGSTRMRGLTAANISTGGIPTSLPLDSYNIDRVEISRGPNSTLFGLGNSGGGVNIIRAQGNLAREITTFAVRGDSYGGHRANFDVNRPILKDRLAVRLLGVYDAKGFMQKPSADTTRRFEVSVGARPFNNTRINASFESYRNFNNRPNSTTPRDMTTDWIASGKPTYDPITRIVHFGDGRPPIGPISNAQQPTLLPDAINVNDSLFFGRPSFYIDHGQVELYTINGMPAANASGPNSTTLGSPLLLQNTTFYFRHTDQYPLFTSKGITDRSIYDWTKINLLAPNYQQTWGEQSNVELEQIFLRTPPSDPRAAGQLAS